MKSIFIKLSSILVILLLATLSTIFLPKISYAQSNSTKVNIDALSDDQFRDFLLAARRSGLNDQQIVDNAIRNGMPANQADKLRLRITRMSVESRLPESDSTTQRSLNYTPDSVQNVSNRSNRSSQLQVFGSELFSNNNLRFEPNLSIATPGNYQIGPGDQLNISVYGQSQANWKLNVSSEGNINIPGSGIVNVSGKSIQQATSLIRTRLLASRYNIGNGTNLQVTLGNIRSIKVIMVGQLNRPGTYTLPSLASAFNALYAAGGPNTNGSYRNIEIIRNNRIVKHLDIYDFLVKGSQNDNVNLQDNDIIRVPTYDIRVEMNGQVKIPAIFEIRAGETLWDVIGFAGGFTDSAYVSRIKVDQIVNQQRRLTEILENDFASYRPLRGDKFFAESIVNRYENRVKIVGSVFRPGDYELEPRLTLSELIKKAQGLKEDAYLERGTITRLKADNTTELISFKVSDVMNGQSILLQREDVISIVSLFDLRDTYSVSIVGAVRKPGTFSFAEKMKLEDLILQAGGFAEGASTKRIEVARRSKVGESLQDLGTTKIFIVDSDQKLGAETSEFLLEPYDIVSVFAVPGFQTQKLVRVEGEVLYPGTYAINNNEKISDLVKRAGGLTQLADISGATLKRINSAAQNRSAKELVELRQVQANVAGNNPNITAEVKRNDFVGINLEKILEKPGAAIDLYLQNEDLLRVPKTEQVVKVNGEVLFPSTVVYEQGKSLRSYIDNAGSYSPQAWAKRPYVIYPNGSVRSTKKFMFIKFYPRVRPGSEIFVPTKPVRNRNTIQEVFGVAGGLASIAAIVFGIISLTK